MELESYFTADVAGSWQRCYPVWRNAGRVNDRPHGVRFPRYIPSIGKRLGVEFASRFRDEWRTLIPELCSEDPIARVCAFDLLEDIAWDYYCNGDVLPEELTKIEIEIPEPAMGNIRAEHLFKDFTGTAVGEFLSFMIAHG